MYVCIYSAPSPAVTTHALLCVVNKGGNGGEPESGSLIARLTTVQLPPRLKLLTLAGSPIGKNRMYMTRFGAPPLKLIVIARE